MRAKTLHTLGAGTVTYQVTIRSSHPSTFLDTSLLPFGSKCRRTTQGHNVIDKHTTTGEAHEKVAGIRYTTGMWETEYLMMASDCPENNQYSNSEIIEGNSWLEIFVEYLPGRALQWNQQLPFCLAGHAWYGTTLKYHFLTFDGLRMALNFYYGIPWLIGIDLTQSSPDILPWPG